VTALKWVAFVCALVAVALAGLRWLRVAQREHYLAGSVTRFASRWWRRTPVDLGLFAAAAAAVVASAWFAPAGILTAAIAIAAPFQLGIRGRTARLVWTRRLTTVAVAAGILAGLVVGLAAVAAGLDGVLVAAALAALAAPAVIDLALLAIGPLEDRLAQRYVQQATETLHQLNPTVVAVTGSYGKTTTKGYIAHLVAAQYEVLASPASYNNRAGLARTVNEHLRPGVQVLVAEMGTYGPGEIAALCQWMTPTVAVITAIGPAHLERFKSLDRTLAAKAEISERASVTVLNVDDDRLAGLASQLENAGKHVIRASGTNPRAEVAVVPAPDGIELRIGGKRVGVAMTGEGRVSALSNVACAAGAAIALGISAETILPRLATLPVPPNRLQRYTAEQGYVVLDDTFNANPLGARLALKRLETEASGGRRVLVTPGMVELGPTQRDENVSFAEAAAVICSDVVCIARTNKKALADGVRRSGQTTNLVTVDRLDQAVEFIKSNLGPGDVVLYENDLPDHFP
jgi:UDP-N-acetylmuramoyl-tripeptide--D-alanyl-D-alanine ligase